MFERITYGPFAQDATAQDLYLVSSRVPTCYTYLSMLQVVSPVRHRLACREGDHGNTAASPDSRFQLENSSEQLPFNILV